MSELPPLQPEHEKLNSKRAIEMTLTTLKYSLLLLLTGLMLGAGAAIGFVASLVKEQPALSYREIQDKIFSQAQTSFAYFNEGQQIGQLRTEEDRRLVSVFDVSPRLIQAIVATEDRLFYEHYGVNINGLFRAGYESIGGSSVQTGGSSLTQQLVKQTILTPEVNLERKAREIFLALRLERMFSKDQIIEAYMNKMYFGKNANGSNIYGVQAAAKGIFGVDVKDLNLPQSAYIAGMLQAPSRFVPFNPDGLQRGKDRQRIVLDRMLEVGYITPAEYREALAYDIKAHLREADEVRAYSKYPHLMMTIEYQAAKVLLDQDIRDNPELSERKISEEEYRELVEFKRKEVLSKGYHVYTTIDKQTYEMMNAIADNDNNFARPRSYTLPNGKRVENAIEQVGATLLDNKTGAVLGFIGGRDFQNSQYNHTAIPRQPGSTMKPIAAYAPAFELGLLQPGFVIDDSPLALDNGPGNPPFYPSNYDNRFRGPVTTRIALQHSYNIPAIKAYLEVGTERALDYVQKMGITTIVTPKENPRRNDYQSKTLPIGGLTEGVTVEELTNAFSVFANDGVLQKSFMISKITDSTGSPIFEHRVMPRRVYSEQTAYLMTDMMRSVVQSGTATSLKSYIGGRPVAGKTGTTNRDVDSWFVGYTPDVSLGVWIGYDERYPLPNSRPPRSIQIWGKIMRDLGNLYPDRYPRNANFSAPSGIVRKEICAKSGKLASEVCRQEGSALTEIFNASYAPTEVDRTPPVIREDVNDDDERLEEEREREEDREQEEGREQTEEREREAEKEKRDREKEERKQQKEEEKQERERAESNPPIERDGE
ncbi:hypothetical protein BEP19_03675 [Ammoniphilus oxalaticus]|uniref:Uncharacterized protein n=1 Tax=Ammoniphilus oxalaticus TaxID=66863 RepID=A0A419SLQ2_9BACL|nr:transglycosylase domain-containing protein [Ammoniphilus oxalaticus]RKD24946.1 hypothetical protein BEP19_03675 [Ammoniphilus oxalaticus]